MKRTWGLLLLSTVFWVGCFRLHAYAATLRVAVCQIAVTDGDVPGNLAKVENYVQQAAAGGAKICVFPELVDVGFGSIVRASTGAEHARPIPGETANALGAIAVQHDMWIVAALLEAVDGGGYDTNVIIDNRGVVVLKQRKAFVYPAFGGAPAYQGNYHDARVVDSPWGPLGVMNCADIGSWAKRGAFPEQQPSLMLVTFANPQANLLDHCAELATECGCPVVGTNMVFPGEAPGKKGGKSRFCSAGGAVLWQAPAGVEITQTWDLTVDPPANLRPRVYAGEVQTIRLPNDTATVSGYATDDGLPTGALTTTWSKFSGPGAVSFGKINALATTATFSASGVYVLRLTAGDGSLSQSDDVAVNILPAGSSDPNAVGRWTFDNTADDSSGMGNHGATFGNPSYSTDVAPTGTPNSHSLDLDGNGDYVRVAHHASLNATEAATIALWVKPRSYPGFWPTGNDWTSLLNKGSQWGRQNYQLGFGAYFYLHSDSMGMRIPCLDDAVRTPNQWYHVAAVLDSHKKCGKIFINGVLDHTVFNVPTVQLNSDPLYIGAYGPTSSKIDGRIDDVRLYTRALSDAEVASLVPGAVMNQPPAADTGPDTSISTSSSATLQGSYSDDGRPATSAIAAWTVWRKISGPGEIRFGNPYAPVTTATFAQPGEYTLELQASDGAHVVHDVVTATVNDGSPLAGSVSR